MRRDDMLTAVGWGRDLCTRILQRGGSGAGLYLLIPGQSLQSLQDMKREAGQKLWLQGRTGKATSI